MGIRDYKALASEITELLGLKVPPLAMAFPQEVPSDIPFFEETMPEATQDGRTGRVSAGCVFWMKAEERTFATVAEDHANCSVGSVTHGLKPLEAVASRSDVAYLIEAGWVTPELMPKIPTVKGSPRYVTYGPLHETPIDPDVVFMRINPKQAMVLSDAFPEIRFEGKPQCHIIAIAKEHNELAVSVGCMLSRVRTGMANTEMTCAVPGGRLVEVLEQLRITCQADKSVAAYASDDAKRFA